MAISITLNITSLMLEVKVKIESSLMSITMWGLMCFVSWVYLEKIIALIRYLRKMR